MKETYDDTKRWKDIPCSWILRVNIPKMTILLKAIYRLNATKKPMSFFTEIYTNNFKISIKYKTFQIAKTILRNMKRTRGIMLPDFRLYYKAMIIKMVQYWEKKKQQQHIVPGSSPSWIQGIQSVDGEAREIYRYRER